MEEINELRRIWQKSLFPVVLPVLLLFAWLVGQNIGFPQTVEESLDVTIYTQDRRLIASTMELKGTVTNYPLNKQKRSYTDDVEVFVGERRVAVLPWHHNGDEFRTVLGKGWTGAIRGEGSLVLIEQDLSRVFPEEDNVRCVLIAPDMGLEGVWARIDELDPEVRVQFAWLETLISE